MDTLSTNIWKDIFGVSNETAFGTIVPALIAILIFLLGFLFRWIGSRIKVHKENNQKREFIFSQIEVLTNAVSEQITAIQKFIELLQVDKDQSLNFDLKVSFNPKHLNQIGSNEIFIILVLSYWTNKRERLEIYNSLIKQLDLIDGLKNQSIDSHNYLIEHSSNYHKKWNENIEIIGDIHDAWINHIRQNNMNIKSDPFLFAFQEIYHKWAILEDYTDMYIAEPNLIDKTLTLARTNSQNPNAIVILRPLLRCKDAVDDHRNLRNFTKDEFNKYLTKLGEIENKLRNRLIFYKIKRN